MSKSPRETGLLPVLSIERFRRAASSLPLLLPVLLLLPKISAVVPRVPYLHNGREIANAFRSIAIVHFGLNAFHVVLPGESYAGVGLYQLLCAPLVRLGFISGGRMISLLSAVLTAIILYKIVSKWESHWVAVLGVAVMFAQPIYWDMAVGIKPEALSILFVVFCIWQGQKYVMEKNRASLIWCFIGVFFGTLNHGWEAFVLLPLGFLLLRYKHRGIFIYLILVAICCVAANKLFTYVTGVPPLLKATFNSYSVFFHYRLLFQPGFWISRTQPVNLADLTSVGDIYLSAVLLACLISGVILFIRPRKPYDRFLSVWLFSGAAIPLMFPRGFAVHAYYGWAMLAPLSVTASIAFSRLCIKLVSPRNVSTVLFLVSMLVILIASAGILVDNRPIPGVLQAQHDGLMFRSALLERKLEMKDVAIVVAPDAEKFTSPQYTFLLYSQIVPLGYDAVLCPTTSSFSPTVFKSFEAAKRSAAKVIIVFSNRSFTPVAQVVWK